MTADRWNNAIIVNTSIHFGQHLSYVVKVSGMEEIILRLDLNYLVKIQMPMQ